MRFSRNFAAYLLAQHFQPMKNPFRFSRATATLLGAGVLMIPLLASCGGGGGGSSSSTSPINAATPAPTAPSNSTCDNTTYTPNYAASVSLLHWSAFPLRVYFVQDTEFSAARKATALAGFNQWVTATGNRADYAVVDSASKANVTVSFYQFTGGAGDTLGTTTVTYGRNNVIQSAQVKLGITGKDANDQLTAAHEYGHTLGITGHSPIALDLMYFTGNRSGDITPSDLNTAITAYCNNFNRNTNRTSAAVGPLKTLVIH